MSINNMKNDIKILCQDDKVVIIPKNIIPQILILAIMIEDLGEMSDDSIPLQVESNILMKIVEYIQFHLENPNIYQEANSRDPTFLVDWDKDFIDKFLDINDNHKKLLQLYKICHYLDIPTLRKMITIKFADMIYNSKTPENIRKTFGLSSSLSTSTSSSSSSSQSSLPSSSPSSSSYRH